MASILTLTLNPAIDVSTSVERLEPIHKLRCGPVRRDPGGGGINVARVVRRLGSDVVAVYPAGGLIGALLRKLTDAEGVQSRTVATAEETREDFTVFEAGKRPAVPLCAARPSAERAGVARLPRYAGAAFDATARLHRRQRKPAAGRARRRLQSLGRGCEGEGGKARRRRHAAGAAGGAQRRLHLIKPNLREMRDLTASP